ncbi:flagellar motor protein MotD [Propionivibrio sp.]|uniref:flagellar motor protein MotD n=1 Tax=Propionivibrio sp. TaxID=2212460 RepID=UPI0025D0E045|nr:flagellar motor protein MotD [Propionivibrio sp.]MBK7355525.1 flagellar motor protein MotD [Propionivibrio sp.]MBK8400806.1 flagellar motor protein MotD [Propionivibrio sp.]MBK8744832.1 flagellar motor protein MotD [Propionivibrio sp.]MBK8893188.1 flagellar motor protein MotD [Propionivibrio sp.]MBL0207836.1 flagellar motor protein MotD [Propionivibrio sp.]
MARRKRPEEHDNHERWLVSYADFITLLFAFFVVMYALSTVNEGKYRILSDSMSSAFRNVPINSSSPLPVTLTPPIPVIQKPSAANRAQEAVKQKQRDKMRNVAKDILEVMAPLIEQGKVRVIETSRGVTIEINDSILFAPGQALLQPALVKAMGAIAEVLAPTDFPITIEGHTDNVPINTAQFPSNWELSAVRATTVLRLFADSGVASERLTAIGYADTRPVEPNLLADGRARNRRVTILIDSAVPETGKEVDLESKPAKNP